MHGERQPTRATRSRRPLTEPGKRIFVKLTLGRQEFFYRQNMVDARA